MADIDRSTYAYERLKEAARVYDAMGPSARERYPELAAQIAIGHYLKLLVDSQVRFADGGNVQQPK